MSIDKKWLRRMADAEGECESIAAVGGLVPDGSEIQLPTLDLLHRTRIAEYVQALEARHGCRANEIGGMLESASQEYGWHLLPNEVAFILDLMVGVGVGTGIR